MVREYKGAFSGEHGDGLVRSEWVAWQFGPRLAQRVRGDQGAVRPGGPHESGQDRRPAAHGRSHAVPLSAGSSHAADGAGARLVRVERAERSRGRHADRARAPAAIRRSGFAKAVEMCNNNGHCRKFDAGTMCPSFRVTRDEQHLTRGRANTLRLALSGHFGDDFASEPSARGARPLRELQGMPARMPDRRRHGADEDRVPAPVAEGARPHAQGAPRSPTCRAGRRGRRASPWLVNLRNRWHWLARPRRAQVRVLGAAQAADVAASTRSVRRDVPATTMDEADVVLFVDTFTHYFEPENARAALRVLGAAGYRVAVAQASEGERVVLRPHVSHRGARRRGAGARAAPDRGARARGRARHSRSSGLEPSCLLSLARRIPRHGPGRRCGAPGGAGHADRGVPRARARRGASCGCRFARCRRRARCCTGIATRRRST